MTMKQWEHLGVGWKFPVRLHPRGGFSYSRYEEDVEEAIWIILGTAQGERQMQPRFGCGIHNFVFAPNSATTRGHIALQVRKALVEWEPRIDVIDVRVIGLAEEPNKLLIRVDYRLRANNALHNLVYPFYIQEGGGF